MEKDPKLRNLQKELHAHYALRERFTPWLFYVPFGQGVAGKEIWKRLCSSLPMICYTITMFCSSAVSTNIV